MAAHGAEGDDIVVGDTILIQGRHIGVVKFVGVTKFDPQKREWIGVELERAIGKHDGKVKSVRYFTAKAKHGTFVPRGQCEKFTEEKAAARKIQSAARMKMAQKKVREEAHWRTWNLIDAQEEQLHLQRRAKLMQGGLKTPGKQSSASRERAIAEIEEGTVPDDYDGVHITFPLTMEQIMSMIDAFKRGKPLHVRYVLTILREAERALTALPTLVHTTVKDGERLAVVGDTHGQLQDLYSVLTINGIPDERNRYIFNGDFVDRGDKGCEIVLTLFCLFLFNPASCMLNRGNHEERSQNETGGFLRECMRKYGPHGQLVYQSFHGCFDSLPLATLISRDERKVFVVHGGLFDRDHNVRLDHISAITRKREIPWGRETFEDRIFEDMLWSDPKDDLRGTEPSTRGAGVFFGPDVTERFCAMNGISLVIRSHECVKEGYLYQHGDRCLTIFSASHYCGTSTNTGAFIVFDPDLTNVVQQFIASTLENTNPQRLPEGATTRPYAPMSLAPPTAAAAASPAAASAAGGGAAGGGEETGEGSASASRQAQDNRARIIERIVLKKPDLYWYFTNVDKESTGFVTRMEWAEAMRTVLRMPDLPWITLSHDLVDAEPDGRVNYARFLGRYALKMRDMSWQDAIMRRVTNRLFELCSSVEDAYKLFDADRSGRISYHEFVETLERLDVGLTRTQLFELMRSIDQDEDSQIDFNEFTQRFHVVFESPDGETEDEWARTALLRLGRTLFADGRNAAQVFKQFDADENGSISHDEFKGGLVALGMTPAFTDEEVDRLMNAIDTNKSGRINYVEFLEAFKVVDKGESNGASDRGGRSARWQDRVVEQVLAVLYEYRVELRGAFEKFDLDGSGKISLDELRVGLKALTGAVGSPLTDMQVDELMNAWDKNHDGELSYEELLEGMQIVDMNDGGSAVPTPLSSPMGSPRGSGESTGAAAGGGAAAAAAAGGK